MGSDTYRCFLDSESYYRQSGIQWTEEDASDLSRMTEKEILLFERTQNDSASLKGLSSTHIRNEISRLWTSSNSEATESVRLSIQGLVPAGVLHYILENKLYKTTKET